MPRFLRAVLLAVLLSAGAIAGLSDARAQVAPIPPPPEAVGFDAYRAAAITAGVVVGVVAATIVTDGLIIPVYAWVTGGSTVAAGPGMAGAGGSAAGYGFIRGVTRLFGAVAGGLAGDGIYVGK